MAKNTLLDFVKVKLKEKSAKKSLGPVVTVSREFGCPGRIVADELAKQLSRRKDSSGRIIEWEALGKEIISEAAKEMHLSPKLVENFTREKPRGIFGQFFASFSDHYVPNDIDVKKTVANVVRFLAKQGHVVIIGRGGAVLTRDIKDSLHIRLYAPVEWRVKRAMEMEKVNAAEARKMIDAIDRERIYLRNVLAGETTDMSLFDVAFNCQELGVPEIVAASLRILELKKII